MPSAAEHLVSVIDAAGGAVRFDVFLDEALYGPEGFYTSGRGRAGRRGDFITSPEIGPLFGTVLARALDAWWAEMGEPKDFRVVEFGAGPGTLARAIVAARPSCLRRGRDSYVAVDIAAHQRALHPGDVTSTDRFEDDITGVVLANELLDNLPFRLMVWDGMWCEAWIGHDAGRFLEVLRPADPQILEIMGLPDTAPLGARVPYQERAGQWVHDTLGRLQGRLVIVDYMVSATSELVHRPWREWLRTFVGHERGGHYLIRPGEQDVTCDVCLDQLCHHVGRPDVEDTQSQFLERWGIAELVDEGKRFWTERAAHPDLEAIRMRSRISEAEALLDPSGLGAFRVVEFLGLRRAMGGSHPEN